MSSIMDYIVEKNDFFLPGNPHFDHRTVITIPIIGISPTIFIFILSPEIIDADEEVIKILFGFDWKLCSCAFDTPLAVLLYLYLSLFCDERDEFRQAILFFGNTFMKVEPTSFESFAAAKVKLFHDTFLSGKRHLFRLQ